MKTVVYCKPTEKGIHSFYIVAGTEEFFLFNQAYRRGVEEYFGKGVLINNALDHSKAHKDSAISRTMSKIPMYVRYVEKEYDVAILEKTKKSNHGYKMRCA